MEHRNSILVHIDRQAWYINTGGKDTARIRKCREFFCAAPTTGGGSFSFTYINQDGIEQTAPTQSFSTAAANIASIITSEQATAAGGQPFLRLASGDTGIRSIVTWTNLGASGGLGAVALVKPLTDHVIREINTPSEITLVSMRPGAPRVVDGAYLGLIMNCAATVAAGLLVGRANFAWS